MSGATRHASARPRRRELRDGRVGGAADAIGPVSCGMDVFVFTHGQFSLIDSLVYLSGQIGPCDMSISTWTAGNEDLGHMAELLAAGSFRSVRWLVDRSFVTRQPAYCSRLRELFGDDSIRTTRTHSKFVVMRNDDYDLAIRTSMNLNHNPRAENIEISDDPALCDFMAQEVDTYFRAQQVGLFDAELRRPASPGIRAGRVSGARIYPTKANT